ncbi:unnamed protein product [Dicrocoelium dendriticum]|nr:unnamed protein product [Dicrocoelium dendriticum]
MTRFHAVFAQSSLVPLAKIANAPSRSLRLLWAIFTATMFMGLCVCITLVVIQYCQHQTVFQLDYSGRDAVYDQIPGFTICPQAEDAQRILRKLLPDVKTDGLPWQDTDIMKELRRRAMQRAKTLSLDVITHRLPKGELRWDSAVTALSPIYAILQNFSIQFRMQPPHLMSGYRLTVMEQVPNLRTFMCTSFELRSRVPTDRWSYLEIEIDQRASLNQDVSFTVITHERGELPFSAYDRHIQTVLPPNAMVSIYFSKSVTKRLNTARNPCHQGMDAKVLAAEYVDTSTDPTAYEQEFMDKYAYSSDANDQDGSSPAYPHSRVEVQKEDMMWHTDHLDKLRLNLSDDNLIDEMSDTHGERATTRIPTKLTKTVNLFGTEFLYSREACAWAECCLKVERNCNCTCSMHVLRFSAARCEAGQKCEVSECRDQQIPYSVCPLPCVMIKFIKHNEIIIPAPEANMSVGLSKLKLVRSEAVHVAMEEEIFSLAKLFSEVGGLCSLFIGFSCIFLFELLEAAILMRGNVVQQSQLPIDNPRIHPQPTSEQHRISRDHIVHNTHVYTLAKSERNENALWHRNKSVDVTNNETDSRIKDGELERRPLAKNIAESASIGNTHANVDFFDIPSAKSLQSKTNSNMVESDFITKREIPRGGWTHMRWENDTLIIPLKISEFGSLEFADLIGSTKSSEWEDFYSQSAIQEDKEPIGLSGEQFLQLLMENRIKFRMLL